MGGLQKYSEKTTRAFLFCDVCCYCFAQHHPPGTPPLPNKTLTKPATKPSEYPFVLFCDQQLFTEFSQRFSPIKLRKTLMNVGPAAGGRRADGSSTSSRRGRQLYHIIFQDNVIVCYIILHALYCMPYCLCCYIISYHIVSSYIILYRIISYCISPCGRQAPSRQILVFVSPYLYT